ncbi:MAG: hypothetical protein LQ342_008219 [Letrouitia transgressa]|nr:MAG: hypothetical protein LQ342_008219 [Letrouitia transgressa]
MADRRRITGPVVTAPLSFIASPSDFSTRPQRTRQPNEIRKICGPHLLLSCNVKFAPFASRLRRGYVREPIERDLGVHLETALRGLFLSERWPKSGVEISVTVLEAEDEDEEGAWGMMSVLSGCITVASAAIVDAGIDSVDVVAGGVAAIVVQEPTPLRPPDRAGKEDTNGSIQLVMDPCLAEHDRLVAVCVVGYLQARDEITEIWVKGNALESGEKTAESQFGLESLIDHAVQSAAGARLVLLEAIKESTERKLKRQSLSLEQTARK